MSDPDPLAQLPHGERIRSHGQGDGNRIAYWCGGCQRGEEYAPT